MRNRSLHPIAIRMGPNDIPPFLSPHVSTRHPYNSTILSPTLIFRYFAMRMYCVAPFNPETRGPKISYVAFLTRSKVRGSLAPRYLFDLGTPVGNAWAALSTFAAPFVAPNGAHREMFVANFPFNAISLVRGFPICFCRAQRSA